MKAIGGILIGIGLAWIGAALMMETTVVVLSPTYKVPMGRVHNLGLVERRRTHLMLAGGTILVGTILMGFGTVSREGAGDDVDGDLRACPHCAELVRAEAVYCRHCKRDIAELAPEPTGACEMEDGVASADADSEPDPDADVRHSYRDLREAAETAESQLAADRTAV